VIWNVDETYRKALFVGKMAVHGKQPLNGVRPLRQRAQVLKHIQPISGIYKKFANM
jgi:hypothetical protein